MFKNCKNPLKECKFNKLTIEIKNRVSKIKKEEILKQIEGAKGDFNNYEEVHNIIDFQIM